MVKRELKREFASEEKNETRILEEDDADEDKQPMSKRAGIKTQFTIRDELSGNVLTAAQARTYDVSKKAGLNATARRQAAKEKCSKSKEETC